MDDNVQEEKRHLPLSDAEERIAQRAAEIVRDQVALQIGNGVLKIAFYLVGAAAFAFFAWLAGKEVFK